jgi:hypothetical protein
LSDADAYGAYVTISSAGKQLAKKKLALTKGQNNVAADFSV